MHSVPPDHGITIGADVLAIGEILVDFIAENDKGSARWIFHGNAGGAPANVAVALRRLGKRSGFCGAVSRDFLGEWLIKLLDDEGVDVQFVQRCEEPTTLAFVQLGVGGERRFSFYREQTSDTSLMESRIPDTAFSFASAIHVCSVSLSRSPAREATLFAVDKASRAYRFISFDVNWRPNIWSDHLEAFDIVHRVLNKAQFVKMSEDEYDWLFPNQDPSKVAQHLSLRKWRPIWVVTRGERPATVMFEGRVLEVEGFSVDPIDTTGAGDAFTAAFLSQLVDYKFSFPDEQAVIGATRFAHAAAALCVTRFGAIPALPTLHEVNDFLVNRNRIGQRHDCRRGGIP